MCSGQYIHQIVGSLFTCHCARYYKNWLAFRKVIADMKSVQFSATQYTSRTLCWCDKSARVHLHLYWFISICVIVML